MGMSEMRKIWIGWSGMGVFTCVAYILMYKDVQRKRHNAMLERKQKRVEKKKARRQKELEDIKASAARRESVL